MPSTLVLLIPMPDAGRWALHALLLALTVPGEGFVRIKKVVGVLATTVVAAVFGFAGAASASGAATPAATRPAGVAVADPIARVAAEDPGAFSDTVRAVEPYLVADGSGNLRLDVPAEVAGEVDAEALAALRQSVKVFNDLNEAGASADATSFGIPTAIAKFVKKYWGQIVAIAKKSGKWAWYKSAQCSAGAMNALYKAYGGNPAAIAEDIKMAVAIAGAGCVANL